MVCVRFWWGTNLGSICPTHFVANCLKYCITGHEICGKVLSLGSKVPEDKGPRVGEVVVVYPWPGCGQCELCSTENWQLCDERDATPVHAVDGGAPVPRTDTSEETDSDSSLASFQVSNHTIGCLPVHTGVSLLCVINFLF